MEDPIATAVLVIKDDEPHAREKRDSIVSAANVMRRNLSGYVRADYNMKTNWSDWVFGSVVWPRLIDPSTNRPWKDDPLPNNGNEVPLADFLVYLRDWYHPRRKAAALDH